MADPSPGPTLDPGFRPSFTTTAGVELSAVVLQPDAKLLVAGRFDLFHGHPYNGLVRLDANGAVDTRFALWPGVHGIVHAVALQADGKVLLGGDFACVAGVVRHGLARLDANGSLDRAFAPEVNGGRSSAVRVIRLLSDGRLLVGGDFRQVGVQPRAGLARLWPDGALDETFDPEAGVEDGFGVVLDLAPLPDGGVVVAGLFTKFGGRACPGLVRLDAQGSVDTQFAPVLDWTLGLVGVSLVRRQPDGRLLIAGRFDHLEGKHRAGLARLRETGEADEAFAFEGAWGTLGDEPVHDLVVQPDGRIVVTGDFEQMGEHFRRGIARLKPDGAVDESFDPGAGLKAWGDLPGVGRAVGMQTDGRILVTGDFDQLGGEPRHRFGRLFPDGSVDRAYSDAGRLVERVGTVNVIRMQPDGRVLVGGEFERVQGLRRRALARLLPHGALDHSFDPEIGAGGWVNTLALQSGGEVVVGGRFDTVQGEARANLVRLLGNGRLDRAFDVGAGPNGEVYCLALEADGRIVVGGQFDAVDQAARYRLARLEASGAVDLAFHPHLTSRTDVPDVYSLAAQPDGRLILGGYFDAVNGEARSGVARLHPDGSLDLDFSTASLIGGELPLVTSVVLDTGGRVLVAGTFGAVGGEARNGIARLDPTGKLDRGFDPGAGVGGGELPAVYGVALGLSGQSVVVGEFSTFNLATRLNLARLGQDGALDSDFDPQGWMDWWAVAATVEANGDILVGGPFSTIAGQPRQGLARFRSGLPASPSIHIHLGETNAAVAWEGMGTLQSSDSPLGPWQDEPELASPAPVNPDQPARFFRVVR